VAAKSPLGKLKDTAIGALRHPVGTAGKVVGQAKGTAALGRTVAGGVVSGVAAQVATRTGRRRADDAPLAQTGLAPVRRPATQPRQAAPAKVQGDPVAPSRKASAKKASAAGKPPAVKKAPAVERAPAAKKTPAAKKAAAARKTSVPEALAPEPTPLVVPGPEDQQAAREATPADVAKKLAEKAPATKATAQTAAEKAPRGDKLPLGGQAPAERSTKPPSAVAPDPEATRGPSVD